MPLRERGVDRFARADTQSKKSATWRKQPKALENARSKKCAARKNCETADTSRTHRDAKEHENS